MMKLLKQTAIATILVLGSIGSASAITLDSLPGVTGTNIDFVIKDGVATIFGEADSGIESNIAKRHVAKMEGVERVINLVTF